MIPYSYFAEVVKRHLGQTRTATAWNGLNLDDEIGWATVTVVSRLIDRFKPFQANGLVHRKSYTVAPYSGLPSWATYTADIGSVKVVKVPALVTDTASVRHVIPIVDSGQLRWAEGFQNSAVGIIGNTAYIRWTLASTPSTIDFIVVKQDPSQMWFHTSVFPEILFRVIADLMKKMGNNKFVLYEGLA